MQGYKVYHSASAKAGDIVFYDFNANNSPDHVEIVSYVSGGKIYSVGGNTSYVNSVSTSKVSNERYCGSFLYFIRPNYTVSTPTPAPVIDPDIGYPEPTRILSVQSPYMTGDDVRWVQKALSMLGYSISIDGYYGNDTKSVVASFQSNNGLTADGIVGTQTRGKIKECIQLSKGHNPEVYYDWAVSNEPGKITVRGWAFDRDDTNAALEIHVYVGGELNTGAPSYRIWANKERTDVNEYFGGVGNYHGFEDTIEVDRFGEREVYIYAIGVGGGDSFACLGHRTVNIQSPQISDVTISEISKEGYRVTCKLNGASAVNKIEFPTWTEKNDQDDLIWHLGTINGNTATCYIKTSDHNNEYGTYITHIYAWDINMNKSKSGTAVWIMPYNKQVDLGDDFYSEIIYIKSDMALTNNNQNVVIDSRNVCDPRKVWHFEKQSDGTYIITSVADGLALDVWGEYDKDGANVCVSGKHGNSNQRFYIYDVGDYLIFKPANSTSRVLNIAGGATEIGSNTDIYLANTDPSQRFCLNKISIPIGNSIDAGTDFNAEIVYAYANKAVSRSDGNVQIQQRNTADKNTLWNFVRQDNGTYLIKCLSDNRYLSVENAGDYDKANVCVADRNYDKSQEWYIYQNEKGVYLKPAHSTTRVLDIYGRYTEDGSNAGIHFYNGGEAQLFYIIRVVEPTEIQLNKGSIAVTEGETVNVNYSFLPENAVATVTWSSGDANIATVDNGNITGVKAGQTTITVKTDNGITETIAVNVTSNNTLTNLTFINSNIVQIGDKVRIVGAADGGAGGYTYSYYFKRSTNTKWRVLGTENGTNFNVTFSPTAEADYDVKVIVRDSSGNTAQKIFSVRAVASLPLTNVSTINKTTVDVGKAVKMTGKAVGGAGGFTYAFYFKRSVNTKWKVLNGTEFSTNAVAKLKPTAAADYDIRIVVKDADGNKAEKIYKVTAK